MTTRNKLIAKLHILTTQRAIDREDFLHNNFGKSSSAQLTNGELIRAINFIEGEPAHHPAQGAADELRKLLSEVLSILTKSPSARNIKSRGLGIPNDWEVLNPFIAKLTGGRLLNDKTLTMDDLQALRKQLLAIRAKGWFWRQLKEQEAEPQGAKVMYGMPIISSPVS